MMNTEPTCHNDIKNRMSCERHEITLAQLNQINNPQEVIDKAKKTFGVTDDFREAGYILPDGELLDLSGKNNGGEPLHRNEDHRVVCAAINHDDYAISGGQCLDFFERLGPIRVGLYRTESWQKYPVALHISLNTFQTPTEKQTKQLEKGITTCRLYSRGLGCDLEYDVYFDNGDRCTPVDEGTIEHARASDIEKVYTKLESCKKKDPKLHR